MKWRAKSSENELRRMAMAKDNPLRPFLDQTGYVTIDGGLATELEARGHDLSDRLWSARLLLDNPDAIRQVHEDFLRSGADCLITASYQATISGLIARGLSKQRSEELLRLSVLLAQEAVEAFWAVEENRANRLKPIVAASVGPYGAALADGSEYRGDYDLDEQGLIDFHARRWEILAGTPAEILACETIPSLPESRALLALLDNTPDCYAWFSFSCKDEAHINDGTPIEECVEPLSQSPQVAAVGINCTAPRFVLGLIQRIRKVSAKPVIVYPNSGEKYDVISKRWAGIASAGEFADLSEQWFAAGAALIGGCCRTGPEHIRLIRRKIAAYGSQI